MTEHRFPPPWSVEEGVLAAAPALSDSHGSLSYAVGFGGSMIWFGSSAGVALSNQHPEAKSVGAWLRHGWYVVVAYVVGFFVMLALTGWSPA